MRFQRKDLIDIYMAYRDMSLGGESDVQDFES